MENIDYSKAIAFLRPNDEWSLNNNDLTSLIWHSTTTPPTKIELDNIWEEAKNFYDAKYAEQLNAKAALLDRLGITEDEARLLLG